MHKAPFHVLKANATGIAGHSKRGYATHWKIKREGVQQMSIKMQQNQSLNGVKLK
jgi:hypothetical protein